MSQRLIWINQINSLESLDEGLRGKIKNLVLTKLKYLSLKIRARMTIMREINMLNKLRISLKVQVVNSLPMHQQNAVLKMQQTESRLANTPKLVLFRTDYLE